MIDTDKYEGHLNVYGFTFCSDTYQIMEEEGDTERFNPTVALLNDAPLLLQALIDERAEVKRLREELDKAEQERDKYSGVLNLAIPYIGHTGMGIEFEEYMKDDYGITVYGDEYLACDCEGCSGLVKDKYDNYIIKGRGNQESVKCDYEDCPYFYGGEEE